MLPFRPRNVHPSFAAVPTVLGLSLGLVLGLVLDSPSRAQTGSSLNRDTGIQASRFQATADIDTINPFNGNLVIPIPLGGEYPLSETASFGVTLVYNSSLWDHDVIELTPTESYSRTFPRSEWNAGIGWLVNLGRIITRNDRSGYLSPDGGFHQFESQLHPQDPLTAGVLYTTDGSFLRIKDLPGGERQIEFPNGEVHLFNASGLPRLITDQFGLANPLDPNRNFVEITYGANLWTIRDQHNRTHRIYFQTLLGTQVVERVELAAFGTLPPATYRFTYDTSRTIVRGCPHSEPPPPTGGVPQTVSVPFLTSVCVKPNESDVAAVPICFAMNGANDYEFGSVGCDSRSGQLKGLTLPTQGRIEWDYRGYIFPIRDVECSPNGGRLREGIYRSNNAGVGARRLRDVNGNIVGSWTYTPELDRLSNACVTNQNDLPHQLKTTVVDPLLNKTEYFFSVAVVDDGNWRYSEYGAPISRFETDGAGRFVSEKVYNPSGLLMRTVYRQFETDLLPDGEGWNLRLKSERTQFDDQNRRFDITFSDYDGFGHYRIATTGGNLGPIGSPSPNAENTRTTTIDWNPVRGTYPGTYSPWPTTKAWVLHLTNGSTVVANGGTEREITCVDPTTGWLVWRRDLASGTAQQGHDLLTVLTRDSAGNVLSEKRYGGDGAGLGQTGLSATCSLALGAPAFQTNHTYLYGARATSQAAGANFKSLDRSIDRNTGLVATSRDASLLPTTYTYDALGRTLSASTSGTSATRYTYFPAIGASQKARVDIEFLAAGGTGPVLAFERVRWEAFGRIHAYDRRLPSGSLSSKQYRYNALGWKVWESEQGDATKGTSLASFDPFGRPATVRPADGSAHDIQFWYIGAHDLTRRLRVQLDSTGTETEVRASETYNRQGRLWKVDEDSGGIAGALTTEYTYDVGGRMTRVKMDRTAQGQGTQERHFCWDNRGFLLKEKHPEKAAFGDCATTPPGTVVHSEYNALGQSRRTQDGPDDLRRVFDAVGRLTEVQSAVDGKPWKRFTYGIGTSAADRSLGKVKTAERWNYVTLGIGTPNPVDYTALVTETYTYGGLGGRVSQRVTEIRLNGTLSDRFTQTWEYDALGNVTRVGYPDRCATCSPAQGGSAPRTVDLGYTNGFVSSVAGFASSVSYHANGTIASIAHANGVSDLFDPDPNSMPRPAAIRTTGVFGGANWTTGAYTYDGGGNVKAIGGSSFAYDPCGRLVYGNVATGRDGLGAAFWQRFDFDTFGNLKTISSNKPGAGRSIPVDPATNRLAGAGVIHDAAGSVTNWNGQGYTYDPFHQPWRIVLGTSQEWIHLYTADDERLMSYLLTGGSAGGSTTRFTLRDLDGKVLRQLLYDRSTFVWTVDRDYVYAGGRLVAAAAPGNTFHYHLDHLGTPRQITNQGGAEVAFHVYFPFGEEVTDSLQDVERMKFTGHERDLHVPGAGDDLDEMHARTFNPFTGRFTSVDRALGNSRFPQSLNRYAYGNGNPLNLTDPSGASPTWFMFDPSVQLWTISAAEFLASNGSISVNGDAGSGLWGVSGSLGIYNNLGDVTISFGQGVGLGGSITADLTSGNATGPRITGSISGGDQLGGHLDLTTAANGSSEGTAGIGYGLGLGASVTTPVIEFNLLDLIFGPEYIETVTITDMFGTEVFETKIDRTLDSALSQLVRLQNFPGQVEAIYELFNLGRLCIEGICRQ